MGRSFIFRIATAALIAAMTISIPADAGISEAEKAASAWALGIRRINDAHAKEPGETTEEALAARIPDEVTKALETLLALDAYDTDFCDNLIHAGNAAVDLDLVEAFGRIQARLERAAPARLWEMGRVLSRPRFVLRGYGLDDAYLAKFADVLDGVLDAYERVFGFRRWSKVPGKKIRVRVHLVNRITQPPKFEPQFPFHSLIDFPVDNAEAFVSPTEHGHLLLYGLSHELAHLVAMWGDGKDEEDLHTWAHYAGCVIVDHIAGTQPPPAWMKDVLDGRYRSVESLRKKVGEAKPSLVDAEGILSLFLALHDAVGPKAIGAAIDRMDATGVGPRPNRVRYYQFAPFKIALQETLPDLDRRATVEGLWPR